jgi:hypothetical protein
MLIRPWSFAQRDLASIRMPQGTPELWTPLWSSCRFPLAFLQLLLQEVSGRRVDAWTLRHTKAFIVPWRACLWFRRNLGSVPLSDGYLEVFGFLILHSTQNISTIRKNTEFWDFRTRCGGPFCCSKVSRVGWNRPWEKNAFDSPETNSYSSPSWMLEGEGLRLEGGCLRWLKEVEGLRKIYLDIVRNEAIW